jgi:hypothetical protein
MNEQKKSTNKSKEVSDKVNKYVIEQVNKQVTKGNK